MSDDLIERLKWGVVAGDVAKTNRVMTEAATAIASLREERDADRKLAQDVLDQSCRTWENFHKALSADNASLRERVRVLEGALRDLTAAFVNPGDGGEFERGEVPVLDRARALIANEQTAIMPKKQEA